MKIVLELDGWIKKIEIAEYLLFHGYIEVELYPPIDCLVRGADKIVTPYAIPRIIFKYVGKDSLGIPIFRYET